MAKHVLITGFEPFGGQKVNPSEIVARSLGGRSLAGRRIVARIFPVETGGVRERLAAALREETPDVVVCLGQAARRTALALERVALNVVDFEQPDNSGALRKNEVIVRGGPDARMSSLPSADIAHAWHQNGIPGYVSNSAGSYICNQVLYELLGLAEDVPEPTACGFVHLPYLPVQAVELGSESIPSMSLELMLRGIEVLLETVVPWMQTRTRGIPRVRTPLRVVKEVGR